MLPILKYNLNTTYFLISLVLCIESKELLFLLVIVVRANKDDDENGQEN